MLSAIIASPFIGSFLGVLIERLPARRPFLWARSECDSCHHPLGVPDLVPVVSWALAGARCRHCNAQISVFYPLIELAAFAIAVWAATTAGGWRFVAGCVLGWTLLVVAIIDWRKRHRVIVPAAALAAWIVCLHFGLRA